MDNPKIRFIDYTKGLYEKGLDLLDPEKDDFSIIAGCILLSIGLEKLIKHSLEERNPLMTLEKVTFGDILDFENKEINTNKRTVNLNTAFERLTKLHPSFNIERNLMYKIINDRNFLVHGSGYTAISKIEKRVRINIADISELICKICLEKKPEIIFGKEIWKSMSSYRNAFKDDEALVLDKRIKFLKRLYSQGQKLPCKNISFTPNLLRIEYPCPICENGHAEIEIDDDFEIIEDEVTGVWRFFNLFKCESCGFIIDDPNEIETIVGPEKTKKMLYPDFNKYYDEIDHDYDEIDHDYDEIDHTDL